MSEDDTELRDVVSQTLENNGVLGNIRAQLRACVFLALEEQDSKNKKIPLQNQELKNYLKTKNGKIAFSLVKQFLEHFNLQHTLSVLQPEAGLTDLLDSVQLRKEFSLINPKGSTAVLSELTEKYVSSSDGMNSFKDTVQVPERKNRKPSQNDLNELSEPSQNAMPQYKSTSDDPFFDDPVPSNFDSGNLTNGQTKIMSGNVKANYDMSSLRDAPSLKGTSVDMTLNKNNANSGSKFGDLSIDASERTDYQDDFEDSPSMKTLSARSDKSKKSQHSIEEDIDEVIEAEDDNLESQSCLDDLATDITIDSDRSLGVDYMEDAKR